VSFPAWWTAPKIVAPWLGLALLLVPEVSRAFANQQSQEDA
jgi:hypothetical protein